MSQIEFYEKKLKYEIDSWDLSESIKHDTDIIIIDTRAEEVFKIEHIPTAINIPHRTMSEITTKNLDRSKIYVTYCDGIGCNASTKGALNLAKLGFNVRELLGGLDWWKRDGYSTQGIEGKSPTNMICGC